MLDQYKMLLQGGEIVGLVVILVLFVLCLLFLFFISLKTPAFKFLRAMFGRKPLMYVVRRDQLGEFELCKKIRAGTTEVKKKGVFFLSENSHTLEKNSKVPIFLAFGEFGATMPPEYPAMLDALREAKIEFSNYKELTEAVEKLPDKEKYRDIPRHKTINLHNMANMYPKNINPGFVEAKAQYEKTLQQRMLGMTKEFIIFALILMIGGALAFLIASKALGDKAPPEVTVNVVSPVPNVTSTSATVVTSADKDRLSGINTSEPPRVAVLTG